MNFRAILIVIGVCFMVFPALAGSPTDVQFEPVEDNPVLAIGEDGTWDDTSIRFPKVLFHEGQYHMFYTSYHSLSEPQAIGYAVSEDGVNWERVGDGPVFEASDGSGFDSFSISSAVPFVEEDGTWVLYYNGTDQPGAPPFGTGIGRATAPTPTGPWTRLDEPILVTGSLRRWDGAFIFPDAVLQTDEGYVMYFSGNGTGKGMVGMATSPDGLNWTKYNDSETTDRPFDESDPVLLTSEDGWDSQVSWGAGVRQTEHGWEMVYTGGVTDSNGFKSALGYAFSEDGIHWTKYNKNPVVLLENELVLFASLLVQDGQYLAYYGVAPGNGTSLTQPNLAIGSVTHVQDR